MSKIEKIERFIIGEIEAKRYHIGDQIPTEASLMEQFDVSRMTVNKALSNLRAKNYLYSVRGKGTFVKDKEEHKQLNELISFAEEMRRRGIKPITQTLEFSYSTIGYEEEKKLLQLDKNDGVYRLVRVRHDDKRPIAMDIAILSQKVTGIIEYHLIGESLYRFLEEDIGIEIDYSIQKLRATKADAFFAEHLQIECGDPLLKISNVTYTKQGIPFEVVDTYYVHDAYTFEQICRKNV
ncbi:GntR family transcriptional regulator [Vallitalea pronyensis]|uniref:GntR family transcriptional regulator n=1 Tax=Vallitalea pronyensis TaxID=1348613 RepID=A0A8J8ML87_9FIRM|nr:GntR family transcriptional regulator [Vallitalea pronyensis]QUI23581.1 GntR family transcriptional regulator [Vallitalea pronyensis]